MVSRADFISAYTNLLEETIQYACPRPEDYRKYLFVIHGGRFKYEHCESCNLPKAFFHYGPNYGPDCNIDEKYHVDLSNYGRIMEIFRKHPEVSAYEDSVNALIQQQIEEKREAARTRVVQQPQASVSSLSVDDLIRAPSATNAPKIKCPRWSSGIRVDNYIQSLEDWFITCNIKNEVAKYTLVLEAFKESDNELLKPLLDNFISSVRPELDEANPQGHVSVLVPKFLKEKFHLNTLTKSVETWKKLLLLEHDASQTEIFISNLHTLFEDCKQFNLTLTESQKAAFMLAKLNVDHNTYRNVVANSEDLADPSIFKTIESNVRKNCNLPSQIVSSVNYMSFDSRTGRSRSRHRREYNSTSSNKSHSKSRSKSREFRDGRKKSRSKSRGQICQFFFCQFQ